MANMTNDELLKLLRDYMARHHLHIYELAQKLDTSQATVSRWLNQRHTISKVWSFVIQNKLGN